MKSRMPCLPARCMHPGRHKTASFIKPPGRWANGNLPTGKRIFHELFHHHHRRCNGFGPDRLRPPCGRGSARGSHRAGPCGCYGCYRIHRFYGINRFHRFHRFDGFNRRNWRNWRHRGKRTDCPGLAINQQSRPLFTPAFKAGLTDPKAALIADLSANLRAG